MSKPNLLMLFGHSFVLKYGLKVFISTKKKETILYHDSILTRAAYFASGLKMDKVCGKCYNNLHSREREDFTRTVFFTF